MKTEEWWKNMDVDNDNNPQWEPIKTTYNNGTKVSYSYLIDDISEPREGFRLPEKNDVQKLLDFTNDWDQSKPIIIHCHMGISRSTATSLGVICKYDPDNLELHVEKLKELAPHASPNKLMTKFVDEILNLDSRLAKTLDFFDPEPIEESRIVEIDF